MSSGANYWVVALWLLTLELLGVCQGWSLFGGGSKNKTTLSSPASTVSSTTPSPTNLTIGGSPPGKNRTDPIKAEAGTIAGTVFGILIAVTVVTVLGVMYLKRKRARDAEYHRQTHVLKTSSQSAGVYMDTTIDSNNYTATSKGAAPSRKYTSLSKKNPDVYEDDSEDELWTAN